MIFTDVSSNTSFPAPGEVSIIAIISSVDAFNTTLVPLEPELPLEPEQTKEHDHPQQPEQHKPKHKQNNQKKNK